MPRIAAAVALLAIPISLALPACANAQGPRPAAVAGSFYPDDAKQLERAVRGFLADAVPPKGERPIAIIVPHAGYLFSGQIAADAYRQAMGFPIDVVVILGTNHTVASFDGVSVFEGSGFRTPLGTAPIDQDLARALSAGDRRFAYRPEAHEKEHSEEVQVPFVQVAFPKAKIVTAIVGTTDPAITGRFGAALAKLLANRNALIVASSDLSHYPEYADALETDTATLRAAATLDPKNVLATTAAQMRKGRRNLVTCACGEGAILAAIEASRALGAKRAVVVSYANSGDSVAADRDRVVGYGSVMYTAGTPPSDTKALDPQPVAPASAALTAADRAALLKLARTTLERWLTSRTAPLPRASSPVLRRNQGAFVTLNEHGQLRGCIGNLTSDLPLAATVARMTIEAATNDPRFDPVRPEELASIDLEVSVLTPRRRVTSPDEIQVGRDGVVLEKSGRSAVFLPQVAPEQRWNRTQMLDNLCLKAGLAGGCWREGATLSIFQADVFGEPQRP